MSARSSAVLEADVIDDEGFLQQNSRRSYDQCRDYLKEQINWDIRDDARQVIPYRERQQFDPEHSSKHLAVPVPEKVVRRPRALSDTRLDAQKNRIVPESEPLAKRNVSRNAPDDATNRRTQWPDAGHNGSNPIKTSDTVPEAVQSSTKQPLIVQPDPSKRPLGVTPKTSKEEPLLGYKYLLLQNTLIDIREVCRPFVDVQPAKPQDLTFAKLIEQVQGFELDLEIWHHVANIDKIARTGLPTEAHEIASAASRTLDRLINRATEFQNACVKAKPGDLRFAGLPVIDDHDDDMFHDSSDDYESDNDPTESLGYIINSNLHSIEQQIQSLKRLTRCLQEISSDATEEVDAVAGLVEETKLYFGSEDALNRYSVDEKYSGRQALSQAKYAEGR